MYDIQPQGFFPLSEKAHDPHVLTMYRATHQHPGRMARAAGVVLDRPASLRQVWVYLVYHYIERPIKRTARSIANSGHWSY